MPNDPLKNKDRDEKHRRRREAGGSPDGDDDPDGREVAQRLYGGSPDEDNRPRCDNCGKPLHENEDIGCTKCDPRARRAGMAGPVPTPTNQRD